MAWYNFWKSEENKITGNLERIEELEDAISQGAGADARVALKGREEDLNKEIEHALVKGTSAASIIDMYDGNDKAQFEERVNSIAGKSEDKIAQAFTRNIDKIDRLETDLDSNVKKLESGELLPAQEASLKDLVERQSKRLETLIANVENSSIPIPEEKEGVIADAKITLKVEDAVAEQIENEAQAREQANKINNPLVPPVNANEAGATESVEQKAEQTSQKPADDSEKIIAFNPNVVNEDIRKIQGFVGAGADGRLGEETLAKVNEFMDLEGDAKFTKETGIDGDAVLARIEAIQNEPAFQKMKEAGFSKEVVAAVQNELGLSDDAKRGSTIGAVSIDELDDLIQLRDNPPSNTPDARTQQATQRLESAAR